MNLFDYTDLINDKEMHIATVNKEDRPNIAVARNVKVLEKNKIIICASEMSNTPKNIETNPNVAITVFNKEWEGLRIFGTAKFYPTGEYYDFCWEAFFAHNPKNLASGIKPKGAIVVTVDKVEEMK